MARARTVAEVSTRQLEHLADVTIQYDLASRERESLDLCFGAVRGDRIPVLDLPGPDIASLARGFGCNAVQVETTDQLEKEFTTALDSGGPTVIVVMTKPEKTAL